MSSLRVASPGEGQEDTAPTGPGASIKCVVWDLDNTIWSGVLVENDPVEIRADVVRIIDALDARGILHSIASRNDTGLAMSALERFGLQELFLCPQIHWGSKTESLRAIARELDIGLESLAFVDDDPHERGEVGALLPEVRCLDPVDVEALLTMPETQPRFITEESRGRRRMYLAAAARNQVEAGFNGAREDFLASLGMVLTIAPAEESDLRRAEELTERTHQFNSTGHSYSYDELERFRASDHHTLLLGSLEDVYGSYGTVGLVLVERGAEAWTIKLLLMSCRVLSKGVALLMLKHVRAEARRNKIRLRAEIVPNDKNVLMAVTYKFAGFTEVARRDDHVIFEDTLGDADPWPDHVSVIVKGAQLADSIA